MPPGRDRRTDHYILTLYLNPLTQNNFNVWWIFTKQESRLFCCIGGLPWLHMIKCRFVYICSNLQLNAQTIYTNFGIVFSIVDIYTWLIWNSCWNGANHHTRTHHRFFSPLHTMTIQGSAVQVRIWESQVRIFPQKLLPWKMSWLRSVLPHAETVASDRPRCLHSSFTGISSPEKRLKQARSVERTKNIQNYRLWLM